MILTRILAGSTVALFGLCVWQWTLLAAKDVTIAKRDTDISRLETAAAERNAEIAGEREEFERAAREAEQAHRDELAQIERDTRQRIDDAKGEGERMAAGLRDGSIVLRAHWQECETRALARVSEASAGSGLDDEGAELRRQAIGRIRAAGAEADAWIVGLQQAVRACR